LHLRSILLAVEPSAARQVWDAATREAEAIVRRIRGGADFAEQARLSSNDPSAENGGDMGYMHAGMLPDALQARVNEFKVGEVADPIETLQGIAVLRLEDRIPAKLQPFDRVADRARDLLHREIKEKAWKDFSDKLRNSATVVIYEVAAAPTATK
jgi:parvulin-like peptidyl-prolyl isomerase